MATRMKPNKSVERKDLMLKIEACLDEGIASATKIASTLGVNRGKVHRMFKINRELWAKYIVARKTLTDQAADNIADIIADQEHPQNFAASKFVLGKYKSDLDEHLEAQDDDSIHAEAVVGGGDGKDEVTIVFRKGRDKREQEEALEDGEG